MKKLLIVFVVLLFQFIFTSKLYAQNYYLNRGPVFQLQYAPPVQQNTHRLPTPPVYTWSQPQYGPHYYMYYYYPHLGWSQYYNKVYTARSPRNYYQGQFFNAQPNGVILRWRIK